MIVRKMTLQDCEVVASIHVRGWQAAYRGIMDQAFLDALDISQRAERWRSYFNTGISRMNLVVEKDGKILAFGGGGANRTPDLVPEATGELWALYTDPDCWGHGCGTALLKEFRRCLGTSYCVWAARDNLVGIKFYEKNGGKLLSVTKNEEVGGASVPHVAFLFD